jgi:hypothetical protein
MRLSPCVRTTFSFVFGAHAPKSKSNNITWVLVFIDFLQTVFAQAIIVMLLQIGFCGVGELHLDAPAVDGMHAFKGFSATGTGFSHLFIVDC